MIIDGVGQSFEFEKGNYNVNSFINQFKKLLGDTWYIALDSINNCLTISSPSTFQLLSTSTINYVMGFSSSIFCSASTLGNYIIMPRTCNFLPLPRVHLRCKELSNSCLISKNCDADILVSVPNDSVPNGKIVYRNFMNTSTHLELPYLQTLTINFTDEQNNLINFNGISSYFEIQLDIYKKRPEKPPTFRKVIQELSRILE